MRRKRDIREQRREHDSRRRQLDATKDHSRVTPEGRKLGATLAGVAAVGVRDLDARGEPDERCRSCAFVPGTVPNGCMQTQLDALKAVVEGVPFVCHQADRRGEACWGWHAARTALASADAARGGQRPPELQRCPWEFSKPDAEVDTRG